MFSKALIASSLAVFAAAAATGHGHGQNNGPVDQCNVGSVQCCNDVQPASSGPAQAALGLLGIVLQNLNVPVGLTCNPISVIGAGASSNCAAQPVCCTGNNFNGLVVVGCSPINVGL